MHGVNILRKLGPWAVSAAICVLAVEILGAAMFYRNTKSLVYFNHPKAADQTALTEAVTASGYKRHLHPYFGYTGPYSARGATVTPTNNLGFIQNERREVPFQPEPNDFVVFVFGGSVASRLVNNSTHGRPSLQEALQKLPQLAGKNVVIYNMAQGPGKQPQQLMELAFLIALGQHIDLVLNLDGTLEFVYGVQNFRYSVDPIFPPVDIFLALGNELTPADSASEEYYELAYGVTHARAEIRRYASLLDDSRSGVAYVKNAVGKAVYERGLEKKLDAYNQVVGKAAGWEGVRKLLGLDMSIKTSKEKLIEDIFDIWMRCSDLMKVLANSTGAEYLNIVVPNPHHSKKIFTETEKKAVFNLPESSYLPQGSAAGHAFIESRAEMLKSRGIVSGMTLFDDVTETTYADSTGHLVKLGETMLADFVADQTRLRLASPQGK